MSRTPPTVEFRTRIELRAPGATQMRNCRARCLGGRDRSSSKGGDDRIRATRPLCRLDRGAQPGRPAPRWRDARQRHRHARRRARRGRRAQGEIGPKPLEGRLAYRFRDAAAPARARAAISGRRARFRSRPALGTRFSLDVIRTARPKSRCPRHRDAPLRGVAASKRRPRWPSTITGLKKHGCHRRHRGASLDGRRAPRKRPPCLARSIAMSRQARARRHNRVRQSSWPRPPKRLRK